MNKTDSEAHRTAHDGLRTGDTVADQSQQRARRHRIFPPPKDLQAWRLLQQRRRLQFWRAALVGLVAGGVAMLFQRALRWAEGLRFELLAYLHAAHPLWGWLVLPVVTGGIGALIGWLTARTCPDAAGSGIPNVKGVLAQTETMSWKRLLPVKFFGGMACIGSGFSMGREGPTVQMGAAVGQAVGGILRVPAQARPHLIACGAGAGLSTAFNAPLAGFIFTIEELQREFSTLTYGTALIAAVVADIVTRSFMGHAPAFSVTGYATPPLTELPLFALVGLAAGLLGVAFNVAILWSKRQSDRHVGLRPWQRAGLIGVLVGLVGWFLPEVLGTGHHVAEQVLRGDYASFDMVGFLALLFVGKFTLTVLSYLAGVPGGIFAPMLLLGAVIGLAVGQMGFFLFPDLAQTPAAFAVAGMAAYFSAVVRAPLTGIVLVLEMTHNYEQLLPLLVACMIAYLVADHLKIRPIYDALLQYSLEQSTSAAPTTAEPTLQELVVEPESFMDGCAIRDLGLPEGCLVVTITRSQQEIIPHGDTVLAAGDRITVVVSGRQGRAYEQLHTLSRAP